MAWFSPPIIFGHLAHAAVRRGRHYARATRAAFYPHTQITQLYSGQDIFCYTDNVKFVYSQLRLAIDRKRLALAHHGKHWRCFDLCLTLCDGTTARLSAMIEGLRPFEPDMLRMYRGKTMWTAFPDVDALWKDDAEQMETYFAQPVAHTCTRVATPAC